MKNPGHILNRMRKHGIGCLVNCLEFLKKRYQVDRSVFDKILIDNAKKQGARVIEHASITALDCTQEGRPHTPFIRRDHG